MIDKFEEFTGTLESLGAESVASQLSRGVWASERKKWALDWLARKDSDKRDAREEETLEEARKANALAEEALSEARRANSIALDANRHARNAWIAAAVASIAAIVAAIVTAIL